MHIISAADFPLFCSNSARICLIMPAECSPQKSLIMLEILPAEFIQAYRLYVLLRVKFWPDVNRFYIFGFGSKFVDFLFNKNRFPCFCLSLMHCILRDQL